MAVRVEDYEKYFPPFVFHDEKYLKSNIPQYTAPYLLPENLKEPIDISVGRQLFVDNYLIDKIVNIKTTVHQAAIISEPIIKPEMPYEAGICAPLPDAVLYDPLSKEFKMWYVSVHSVRAAPLNVCVAKSYDGKKWYKPYILDHEFTVTEPCCGKCSNAKKSYAKYKRNILGCVGGCRDRKGRGSGPIIMFPTNKTDKFMLYFGAFGNSSVYSSEDGIDWKRLGGGGKVSTSPWFASYNPFRNKIIFTLRDNIRKFSNNRVFRYKEIDVDKKTTSWGEWCSLTKIGSEGTVAKINNSPVYWCFSAREDNPGKGKIPGIYTAHMVPYESIMLNLMSIFHGGTDVNKNVDIHLGFSRDGFYYTRNFKTFIPQSRNARYLLPTGGNILFMNDEIYFYFCCKNDKKQTVTNMATLRRDGFVSLSPKTGKIGEVHTKLLTVPYEKQYLFVNMVCKKSGSLSVEVFDNKNNKIKDLSINNSTSGTKVPIKWNDGLNIDKPFRLHFYLKGDCHLYSFWLSKTENGESMGYVGSGGPKYSSYCDNGLENKVEHKFTRIQYICKDDKMYIQKIGFNAVEISKCEKNICYIRNENNDIKKVTLTGGDAVNTKLIL